MRIFVSEYLCSGAWPVADLPTSLATEGRAMLLAILADLARLPDCDVCTTWDRRAGEFPLARDVHCELASSVEDERRLFDEAVQKCDTAVVIAPEFDDVLFRRVSRVVAHHRPLLGPGPDAVALCADKLALYRWLTSRELPTIHTAELDVEGSGPDEFPCVIKPRCGAGSLDVALLRNPADWSAWQVAQRRSVSRPMIWQPFVPGAAIFVSALIDSTTKTCEVFPIGRQSLSGDGRFRYLGGVIPEPLSPMIQAEVQRSVRDVLTQMPGAHGYFGFDLIVSTSDSGAEGPVRIVEVNPRLTTSYLGYRQLAAENLAERFLASAPHAPIVWRTGAVSFTPGGEVKWIREK